MNDDSPVLSQESIKISWEWNKEGTPIRPSNKSSKPRRSIANNSTHIQNLQRLTAKSRSKSNQNETAATVAVDLETHSPKGLYKFNEEMRKIQFDAESDTSCDNFNKSVTATDTGYPFGSEEPAKADVNIRCNSNNLDVQMMETGESAPAPLSQNQKHGIDDAFADDLLNDTDFDQMLLTCKIPAQKEASEMKTQQKSVKKASSAPEIKASESNSSGSNWNLIDDDCFDEMVKDFDVDIPCDSFNTSAKFTRHKSMPQQPQNLDTSKIKKFIPQQSAHAYSSNINRKGFTRHESMPITNSSINRPSNANNNSIPVRQNSGLSK